MAKPATANINPALAIPAINIPVQVPATPVAQAQPVVENILNVIVPLHTLGAVVLVLAHQHINIPARVPVTPAVQARLVTANIRPAPAPAVMSGTAAAAKNKSSTGLKGSCIIAMARWLV